MTSLELVPVSVLVMLLGRLVIRRGLGMPVSDLVAVVGRLVIRSGLGVPVSAVLAPVLGRLTIRKGLGILTSSSQSDQNSISNDSNDPDAIFWLVYLLTKAVQPMNQLENMVIALPPSRKTNPASSSSLREPSSCAYRRRDVGNRSL